MIKSIRLKNFQAHEDASLELSTGVNVITGSSDAGKTAILRGLRWAVFNKPSGSSFVRSGTNNTEVEVMLYDGLCVKRAKQGNVNRYIIGSETLTAFGSRLPEAVSELFNLSESNFQQQLERPFLLDQSSGEVAAFFNKTANLDAIDRATTRLKKGIRDNELKITLQEEKIKELETSLKEFENLEAIDKLVGDIEHIAQEKEKVLRQNAQLKRIKLDFYQVQEKEKKYIGLPQSLAEIEDLVSQFKSIQKDSLIDVRTV